MINKAILVARLVRDPELKTTNSGKSVSSFTVACDRMGEGVDFIKCVAWEKQAENLCKYQGKGDMVGIEGSIQVRKYEHNGQNREAVEVVAHRIAFLGGKKQEEQKPQDFEPTNNEIEPEDSDSLPF